MRSFLMIVLVLLLLAKRHHCEVSCEEEPCECESLQEISEDESGQGLSEEVDSERYKTRPGLGAEIESSVDGEEHDVDDPVQTNVIPGIHASVLNVAGADMGVPQLLDPPHYDNIVEIIQAGRDYLEDFVKLDSSYATVRKLCTNQNENCGLWAALGECQNNPGYMKTNCAPLCKSCEELHMETRCPLDPNAAIAWKPGNLSKMFERITTDMEMLQYTPIILSRPAVTSTRTGDKAEGNYQIGPWVVLLDNFLSQEETERIIQLSADEGYNRSSDVGEMKADGSFEQNFNAQRTSENAWCKHSCYDDEMVQKVLQRLRHVTGMHDNNAEYLQVLKYEVGQFYTVHHDYIPMQKKRIQGVRILTVFLYLNDVEGGGTNFPVLDLTVMPKRGRALIWPSVHDEAPNSMDSRTEHQALPVTKGIKYGANAWYHQFDFKTPNSIDCE